LKKDGAQVVKRESMRMRRERRHEGGALPQQLQIGAAERLEADALLEALVGEKLGG
jgi:hypothetical protein